MFIGTMNRTLIEDNLLSCSALIHTNVKHGHTGDIAFNANGERIQSFYEIINIQHGQKMVVGTYRSNTVSMHGKSRSEEISVLRRTLRTSMLFFFVLFFSS